MKKGEETEGPQTEGKWKRSKSDAHYPAFRSREQRIGAVCKAHEQAHILVLPALRRLSCSNALDSNTVTEPRQRRKTRMTTSWVVLSVYGHYVTQLLGVQLHSLRCEFIHLVPCQLDQPMWNLQTGEHNS